MKFLMVGDIHGEWGKLNTLINKQKPDILFQLGDFGFWPSLSEARFTKKDTACLSNIKSKNTKIYWLCGNHEQYSELNKYQDGKIHELEKNIFFCSRGSSLTLPDGRKILFIGGAISIDKNQRCPGVDWFPEETISYEDYEKCMIHNKIDIVMSHTCPEYFVPNLINRNISKIHDPSCVALNGIFDKYKPDLWYFAHWHLYKEEYFNGCHWTCLNYIEHQIGGRSWVAIK